MIHKRKKGHAKPSNFNIKFRKFKTIIKVKKNSRKSSITSWRNYWLNVKEIWWRFETVVKEKTSKQKVNLLACLEIKIKKCKYWK